MRYDSVFKPDLFSGQVILLTGGGSGIGRCITHELVSLGATVAIAGRTEEKLEKVRQEAADDGFPKSITTHTCDIREEDQVVALIDDVLATHGKIDGLVNNAGGQYRQALNKISARGFNSVVNLNLNAGFMMCKEVYNRWMQENGGAVVNIVADMWMGWPNYAHSGASRAGMMNLTESAAAEWAPSGVRVNAVAPGGVASSGFDTYTPEAQAVILEFPKAIPLQRYGNVAEVSSAVVYLLSPAAAFITGSCIRVDGGAPQARPCWIQLEEHDNSQPFGGFHRDEPPKLLTEGVKKAPDHK